MSDRQLERNRRLLDEIDFGQAKEFAERLVEEWEKFSTQGEQADEVVARALWVALGVSYARPFKRSCFAPDQREPERFSKELLEQVPEDFRVRHDRIVGDYRDQVFAHSDASVRDIKEEYAGKPFGVITTSRNPYPPLPAEEVRLMLPVIEKLNAWVIDRRLSLESTK